MKYNIGIIPKEKMFPCQEFMKKWMPVNYFIHFSPIQEENGIDKVNVYIGKHNKGKYNKNLIGHICFIFDNFKKSISL